MTTITAPSVPDVVPLSGRRVTIMLVLRLVLFAAFQCLIAAILALQGTPDAFAASAAWWPLAASAANLVNLGLLARFVRLEGGSLRSLYLPASPGRRRDLLIVAITVLIAVPVAMGPNIGLAALLFGDPQIALDMFVQPLPLWAAIASVVLFPLTIALTELPTYYGYVQPRLARFTRSAWLVVLVPAFFHAIQHATLPLIFDAEFMLWRGLMFLPFAVLVSVVLRRRPSVLPYLMVVHFAIDLPVALMVLGAL